MAIKNLLGFDCFFQKKPWLSTWVDNTAAIFDSSLFFAPLIQYSSNPGDHFLHHLKEYISTANMTVTSTCNKAHLVLN